MLLLISDANILIDMEEGGLLKQMFRLPWTFCVPDLMYVEELEAQHSDLLALGLQLKELTPVSMSYAANLMGTFSGPSRIDCFALALASQERCPLLTGDQALRRLARQESVEIKGTLWLVEQLIEQQIISVQHARQAFLDMRQAARRLPWEKTDEMLARF